MHNVREDRPANRVVGNGRQGVSDQRPIGEYWLFVRPRVELLR